MKTTVLTAALVGSATVASAALPPYDFTGHWTGVILAAGNAFDVEGDLVTVMAKKLEGDVEVNGVPCTVRGKRKKKVKLRLVCLDGTKGKLKGLLDLVNDAVVGSGKLKKSGRRARADFVLEKIDLTPPVCGNGAVEVGEECDDGNTLPDDGCDALCHLEIGTPIELDEIEPNGVPAQATEVPSLPAIAHGAVMPGIDEDFYRIVLEGSDLVLETFDANGPGSCEGGTDTVIELRGPDGSSVVAIDNDGGIGACSRVELHGLTPGVYYPCVRSFFLTTLPAYQLRMIGP